MRCIGQTGRPHLVAIDAIACNAVAHFRHGARIHMCRVRAMIFFGQAETPSHFALKHRRNKRGLLLRRSKITQHQNLHEIADNAAFVLQVIMQP